MICVMGIVCKAHLCGWALNYWLKGLEISEGLEPPDTLLFKSLVRSIHPVISRK